jgi:hypothetical protein
VQNQRVDQGVHDEVVFPIGGAQEVPPIVQVPHDARILVGVIGMKVDADVLDCRVDLDRIDAIGSEVRRVRDVVAGAGADDQHVLERRAPAVLLQQIDN